MNDRQYLGDIDKEAISESVIQRFETCYDTLWKHLKRYLIENMGIAEVSNSPKPIFRLAHENYLLSHLENWMDYANARTATSHDYSFEKVEVTLDLMKRFIQDTIELYQTLSGKIWE